MTSNRRTRSIRVLIRVAMLLAFAVARLYVSAQEEQQPASPAAPSYRNLLETFKARDDAAALKIGEQLLKLGNEEDKHRRERIVAIVADLKRRQAAERFGKQPPKKLPKDFQTWEVAKRVRYLIDALDEVDVQQHSQPGSVPLWDDYRVKELFRIGDAALPDLIETLDNDSRLMRSEHYWRHWVPGTILSVREAALTALEAILRMNLFQTNSTGDNFTLHGEKAAKDLAKKLREYWKEHGALPFADRMMKVLSNPKADFQAHRDAAYNLAHVDDDLGFGWQYRNSFEKNRDKPNPVVARFSQPTAAVAILAVMDAELKHIGRDSNDNYDYGRIRVERHYLQALIALDDSRIAAELNRRAAMAASQRMRRNWAFAAHQLGEPAALKEFAKDFLAGTIVLPADQPDHNPQAAERELGWMVHFLALAKTPEAEQALDSLVDPKHPYHRIALKQIFEGRSGWSDEPEWLSHPYCLAILRRELDDRSATGRLITIMGDELQEEYAGGSSSQSVPEFLKDAGVRNEVGNQRRSDAAAEKLNEIVWGLPRSHVLLKDQDERIAAMKTALDRNGKRYRRLTWREQSALETYGSGLPFVPDIKPLDHAASAADVEQGKAVFHLAGKGKLAKQKLPAIGELKPRDKEKEAEHALLVQAEVDANGETVYGAILANAVRRLSAAELASVKTLEQIEQERKEYFEKLKSEDD